MLGDIATETGVPVAIIDVDDTHAGVERLSRRISAISRRVIDETRTIIVPNVSDSPEFSNDAFLLENGVRFYAGVPLIGPDGKGVGALALLGHHPQSFSETDREMLELHALRLMVELSRSAANPVAV